MKKIELEIISLKNEDVIATSLCSHLDKQHTRVYNTSDTANDIEYYSFNDNERKWLYDGLTFAGEEKSLFPDGGKKDNWYIYDEVKGEYVLCGDEHNHPFVECLIKGTKVTLADGKEKNIEDIRVNDAVLTFNHESGIYEAQPVYFVYASKTPDRYITLRFENGTELSIAGEHDLFEKESRRYVTIRVGNAKEFIGKHFYSVKERKYVELMDVIYSSDTADYYSIYTKYNFNSVAEGMLTCPDDVDAFLNIYEFDENMVADKEALEKDIEKYGLREYDASIGTSEKEFEEANIKYVKVMYGKGLTTKEKLLNSLAEGRK